MLVICNALPSQLFRVLPPGFPSKDANEVDIYPDNLGLPHSGTSTCVYRYHIHIHG